MEAKREQAVVGLFVLVAAGLLLVTVFAISGTFGRTGVTYRADFKHAGGLEAGATVRYAEGPKVGRVEQVRIDPQDPARVEISFSIRPGVPVRTDTVAKIASLSALGENYLELVPGKTPGATPAPPGSVLKSEDYISFADVTTRLNDLAPAAQALLENLNQRVTDLQATIARVNDLLSVQNRANLSASLANVRGMLEENRPALKSTMGHIDTASAKVAPLLDDFKKAVKDAHEAVSHIDATITENRPELRQSIHELRQTLISADAAADQLNRTLSYNGDEIDEMIDNLRHITENLREFTNTIKTKPNTLIFSSSPRTRQPGAKPEP